MVPDLRGHGQSSNFVTNSSNDGGKHTIHNCALDIIETARQLNLTGIENSPIGVVGHSFGGRCALQYAHTLKCMENNADVIPPKYTWLLDTVPGKAHASVGGVIKALTNIELTKIKSKQDMIIMLTSQGIDKAIANWMTTNLKKTGNNQFEFMFDLEVAQGVLDDFPKQDFMKLIDCCTTTTSTFHDEEKVYLVMAGKNGAWTKDIVKGLQFYEDNHELVLVRLPKAGHWVHVDDLDGLMSAMEKSFANVRV
jgi:alpha/beta superfamily hydrolase